MACSKLEYKSDQGKCCAVIVRNDGGPDKKGKYVEGKNHAEIDAIVQLNDNSKIDKIIISSPPCPACCVLLKAWNLLDKVYAPCKTPRDSASNNVPASFFSNDKNLKLLYEGCPGLEDYDFINEHKVQRDKLIRCFLGRHWVY